MTDVMRGLKGRAEDPFGAAREGDVMILCHGSLLPIAFTTNFLSVAAARSAQPTVTQRRQ